MYDELIAIEDQFEIDDNKEKNWNPKMEKLLNVVQN